MRLPCRSPELFWKKRMAHYRREDDGTTVIVVAALPGIQGKVADPGSGISPANELVEDRDHGRDENEERP